MYSIHFFENVHCTVQSTENLKDDNLENVVSMCRSFLYEKVTTKNVDSILKDVI